MPNETLLVRTLVRLADSLVEDFDVVDLLTLLSDRCVDALDVTAAGVMIAGPAGDLQVIASSSDTMRSLELLQLQSREGPCVDCFNTGVPVVNLELSELAVPWPLFARTAIDQGFHSVHSLPMRLRGKTIGALNMFRAAGGRLSESDVTAAQAFADVATIAIIQHRGVSGAQLLNDQLSEALNSRIVIEQAKGKISESAQLTMDEAFERLRRHARGNHLRLTDLARDIASGAFPVKSLDPFPTTKAR